MLMYYVMTTMWRALNQKGLRRVYAQSLRGDFLESHVFFVKSAQNHRRPKNVAINFVHCKRRRQRIVYIYSIHKVGNLISPDEHMTFVKHKIHRLWN